MQKNKPIYVIFYCKGNQCSSTIPWNVSTHKSYILIKYRYWAMQCILIFFNVNAIVLTNYFNIKMSKPVKIKIQI